MRDPDLVLDVTTEAQRSDFGRNRNYLNAPIMKIDRNRLMPPKVNYWKNYPRWIEDAADLRMMLSNPARVPAS